MAEENNDAKTTDLTEEITISDLSPIQVRAIPFRTLERREGIVLTYAGLLLLLVSCVTIAVLVIYLYQNRNPIPLRTLLERTGGPDNSINYPAMVDYYLSIFLGPVILLSSSVLTFVVGYLLLRASGTSTKEVIPTQDFDLLSKLLLGGKEKGIDNYIRLSSLAGLTGLFTKIGLTGLPLATIGLTIIFAIMALFNPSFIDMAKLTLGAFLGSYVQRTASMSQSQQQ